MHVERFGDRAILLTDVDHPYATTEFLKDKFIDAQIRVGIDAVLVEFPEPRLDLDALIGNFDPKRASAISLSDTENRKVLIEVVYDGEDLNSAAALLGIDSAELISRHQRTQWRVAMIGFAPGFPYLVPDQGGAWDLPRLETPRTRVPAGSVAIAAGMSAIYPTAMPGGWHLIGRTDRQLFDAAAAPPSLLQAGDLVRFVERT